MRYVLLLFGCWLAAPVFAQEPSLVTLNKLYTGNLDGVLDDITREHGTTFEYDPTLVASVEVFERPTDMPLEDFLTRVLTKAGLYWSRLVDGTIRIVDWDTLKSEELPTYVANRRYQGPPSRFELTVSGRVTDAATGEVLPFVSVRIHGTDRGETSN
ncbi:MAG: hypothetical protein AAFN92_23005, partial [Bacteroidota bacterium]